MICRVSELLIFAEEKSHSPGNRTSEAKTKTNQSVLEKSERILNPSITNGWLAHGSRFMAAGPARPGPSPGPTWV